MKRSTSHRRHLSYPRNAGNEIFADAERRRKAEEARKKESYEQGVAIRKLFKE